MFFSILSISDLDTAKQIVLHVDRIGEYDCSPEHTSNLLIRLFAGMARSKQDKMTDKQGVGTKVYLAPEQLAGATDYAEASDIF